MKQNKTDKPQQKSLTQRFLFIFGIFFFLLYLFMGLAIIFWKDLPIQMESNYRMLFGVILIVYAFLRFIRLMQNR
ncbi:MAG: hypothetical protein Q4B43_01615 [Bacteroidota bacterium]|nr:hypothetical protein [Bacteroidota bacterium]